MRSGLDFTDPKVAVDSVRHEEFGELADVGLEVTDVEDFVLELAHVLVPRKFCYQSYYLPL